MAKNTKADNSAEIALLEAAGKYIASIGGAALVAGVDRIQGPVDLPFTFELVIRFTGRPPEKKQPRSAHVKGRGQARKPRKA